MTASTVTVASAELMVIATVTVLTYLRTRGVCKARVGLELIARLVECFSKLCRESPHFKRNYWVSLTCVCCVRARVCVGVCVCVYVGVGVGGS